MKINLFGDMWVLTKSVSFEENIFEGDLNIFNLETPVLDTENQNAQRHKAGPHIYGIKSQADDLFKSVKNGLACLSNNHILDYGHKGLNTTINSLNNANISHVGASENFEKAHEPYILISNGIKLAVLNAAEVQFGAAQQNSGGYASLSPRLFSDVLHLKQQGFFVIVSLHFGNELEAIPSIYNQSLCRALVDIGADFIHGHHSHVPQAYECYKGRYIFYGLGNFIVDPEKWNSLDNSTWSIKPSLIIDNNKVELTLEILEIISHENGVDIQVSKEVSSKHKYLEEINKVISDDKLFYNKWAEISLELFQSVYSKWLTSPAYIQRELTFRERMRRIVEAIMGKAMVKKELKENVLFHLFSCESHRQAIATALGIEIGEVENQIESKESE